MRATPQPHRLGPPPTRVLRWPAILALAAMVLLAALGAARASAAPAISLDVNAENVLFGEQGTVGLEASNPSGQPWGYNLSYRVVLPAGIAYVPGSVTAPLPEPAQVDDAGTGITTLVWTNLADLAPASSHEIAFRVTHTHTGDWGPQPAAPLSSYAIDAGAYVNDDARWVPEFDATGAPVAGPTSSTGSATADDTAAITAIEVSHDNPGEILRGVHEHRRTFSATVTNNLISPTTGVVLREYLPAGLEWLGCGTTAPGRDEDKSTDSPTNDQPANPGSPLEYPSSGPLNATAYGALADCIAPDAVETVELAPGNPEGLSPGVYTRLTFDVGTLAPGQAWTTEYVAGVPIRENTTDWTTDPDPAHDPYAQAPNLDNNGGTETHHLQSLPVTGIATGTFAGAHSQPAGDTDTATSTAMDLIVGKSASRGDIAIGAPGDTTWTLTVRSSEYRSSTGIVVTDVLPDGLEAVSANPAWSSSAPGPGAGQTTLTWTGVAGHDELAASSDLDIQLVTRAKSTYADGDPVSSRDSWTNRVDVTGDGWRRCDQAPGTVGACADDDDRIWAGASWTEGDDLPDHASASQTAAAPTIDKRVQTGDANHASVGAVPGWTDAPSAFSPGDRVWYRLTVAFPSTVSTRAMKVADFIPPGTSYVPGTAAAGPALAGVSLPAVAVSGDTLTWDLGDVDPGATFDVAFQVLVERPATAQDGDLVENLMKTSFVNRAGRAFPLRDLVGLDLSQPEVSITTGVSTWSGGPAPLGPNQDNRTVPGGATVTFRVDPRNGGSQDATGATIRAVLPSQLDCSMIPPSSISAGGTCLDGVITWTGVGIAAGGTPTLYFDADLPTTLAPGTVLAPAAGVVSFQTTDNDATAQTWYPAGNIDPAIDDADHPGRRVAAADDPTSITIARPSIAHTIAAPFTQTGNNATTQASIGETVVHSTTVSLPADTTLTSPTIVDTIDTGLTLDCATATATIGGVSLPTAGWTVACDAATRKVTVTGPASYPVPAGGEDVVITYDSVVANTAANVRGATRGSATAFNWGGPGPLNASSSKVSIVEPDVAVAITPTASTLLPGQTVDYLVTASNGSGGGRSTANGTVVVVTVPEGLTPTALGGGTWDAVARTITFPATATLAPGANDGGRTITLQVDNDVIAGQDYQVTARADTESLTGAHTGRRTATTGVTTADYRATATATATIPGSQLVKTASRTEATVGQTLTHTISFPLAANVAFYDLTVIDTLPAGLVYGGNATMTSTCTPAGGDPGDCTLPVTALTPSGQTLGFAIGDVSSAPVVRTIAITYSTRVATTADAGDTLTNSARLYSNVVDGTTPATIPADPDAHFGKRSDPATATTTVVEPAPTITKSVAVGGITVPSSSPITGTDTATYTVTVTNTGTSALHDAVVVDEPDAQLAADSLTMGAITSPAGITVDGPAPAGPWATMPTSLTWLIDGPLEPGDQVVIRYSAAIDPALVAHDDAIENTVRVTESYGLPETDRTGPGTDPSHFREYDAGPATTALVVKLPTLGIAKTAATPPPGEVPAGDDTSFTIAVSNTGPVRATDVTIADVLPSGLAYTAGTATATTTDPAGAAPGFAESDGVGPELEWTLPELKAGATLTITVPVRLDATADAGQTLTNATEASSFERPVPVTDTADILTSRSADVSLVKSGPTDLDAGEVVEWTLVAANAGPSDARDVVVTDSIPAETTLISVTPTPACSASGRDVTCNLGTLDAGDTRTITIRARVNSSTTVDIANTGEITTTDPDPDPANNTSQHPTTVGNRVDLSLTKTGASARIVETLTNRYTLTVRNDGPSDSYDTTVVDTLPAGLTALSASTAAGTCALTTPQRVDCDLGTLAADATATIEVVARGDVVGTHVNTATVGTGAGTDADPSNDTDTATVVVEPLADLAIVKDGPAQVAAGGTVTYELAVTNRGPSPATGVTITDDLPEGLRAIGASPGCAVAGRTVTCAVGDLAVGAGTTRTVTARVAVDAAGRTVQNVARVRAREHDLRLSDNSDTAQTRVGEAADVRLVKSGTVPFAGGHVAYVLDAINDGPSTARNAVVVDDLPEGLSYVDSLATQGSCTADGRRVTCALGDLAAGGAASLRITAAVDPSIPGGAVVANTATVGSDTLDPDPGNNSATAATPAQPGTGPRAQLSLTKTASAAQPPVGRAFDYVLKVTNRGPDAATGVTVHDPMPVGVRVLRVRSTRGSCVTDGPVVRCSIPRLAVRGSATITITAMLSTTGQHVNRAVAAGDGTAPVRARAAVAGVMARGTAGRLAITKSASRRGVAAGGTVRYLVRVRATRASVARATVCDTLPRGMVFARAKGATLSGRRACWTVAWLDPGRPRTFAVTARAELTASGRLRNTATAVAPGVRRVTARATVAVRASRGIAAGGVTG